MTVDDFIEEWNSDNEHIIAHTSGSTGKPKRILLDKKLVEQSALRTIKYFGISKGTRLHLPLSPDYIAGKMMIVRALLSGAKLTYESPSNCLSAIGDEPIHLLAVVPSQLQCMLETPEIFSNIRNIIVGGAPLSSELKKRCENVASNIVETYGMTETASHVALRKCGEEFFKPLDGIIVNCNENKCLVIDIKDFGSFVTNDIAQINSDGSFKIIGRADDAINSGALKVHPAEIESIIAPVISQYFPQKNYIISSLKDEKWGERVVLVIEDNILPTEEVTQEILNKLRTILLPQQRPAKLFILSNFPKTVSGKIIRRKIKELLESNNCC